MSVVQRISRWVAKRALSYAGIPLRDPALVELFGMKGQTPSGVYIDETNANAFSAYYRGVSLISCSIAMLKFECVTVDDRHGTIYDPTHLSNTFFRGNPNPHMTWFQFAEMMTSYAITWGNGVAWIERDIDGFPVAMWPLMPNQMTIYIDNEGDKVFQFKAKYKGEIDELYYDADILHITGYGFDGVQGSSVIKFARDSVGLGISTERFGATFFGNNAVPGFVIEHPAEVPQEARNTIIEDIESVTGGTSKSRRGVVLDEGMKYKQVGVPPEDGQFLQTRQFQVREMARWLGVPPHMLYDLDNANFSTVEGQGLDFLAYTLQPWLERWMQEFKRKLLNEADSHTNDFRVDVSNLVMMDSNTKWDVYSKARNMGYYTLNDIAKMERGAKLPEDIGDARITPSTMLPLTQGDNAKPIDPKVITDVIALIRSMKTDDSRPSMAVARSVMVSTMPDANVELFNVLASQLVSMGICKP